MLLLNARRLTSRHFGLNPIDLVDYLLVFLEKPREFFLSKFGVGLLCCYDGFEGKVHGGLVYFRSLAELSNCALSTSNGCSSHARGPCLASCLLTMIDSTRLLSSRLASVWAS